MALTANAAGGPEGSPSRGAPRLASHAGPTHPLLLPAPRLQTVEDLVRKKVSDPTDFEWLKHARFYWRQELNTVMISMCDVELEYSYEYLGAISDAGVRGGRRGQYALPHP